MLLSVVTLVGGLLRFVRLSFPHSIMFDETYYARDACLYLGKSATVCGTSSNLEQSYVHPPLGKLIIAIGEKIWGFNSFGWRVMAAAFGTGLIVVAFLMGRKLFGRWAGAVTGLLVATDFLLIVQSRIGMLDIFLAFFVALGFLFVICERQRVLRMRESGRGRFNVGWRLGAGLCFGAATAVKWSGLYALAGAGLLLAGYEVLGAWRLTRIRRREGAPKAAPGWVLEGLMTPVLVLVPALAVYLGSYVVAGATHTLYLYHNFSLSSLWDLHKQMYDYHSRLRVTHPYASKPWTWPIVKRPVAYYFTGSPGGKATHIMAFANPFTWWAALVAAAWGLWRCWRRFSPQRVAMIGWWLQYLPWLFWARPQFFFYMTPAVPFMMLVLAGSLRDFGKGSNWRTGIVGAYLFVACVAALWWWFPVVTGVPIPYGWWQHRMLFNSWI